MIFATDVSLGANVVENVLENGPLTIAHRSTIKPIPILDTLPCAELLRWNTLRHITCVLGIGLISNLKINDSDGSLS